MGPLEPLNSVYCELQVCNYKTQEKKATVSKSLQKKEQNSTPKDFRHWNYQMGNIKQACVNVKGKKELKV